MKDAGDIATRRERLQELRQKRQSVRGGPGPDRVGQSRTPGAAGPGLGLAGAKAGGQRQRLKQFANLILKWLENQSATEAETIGNTGVSREGVSKLMTLLANVERRGGPGTKIAHTMRAFLTRTAAQGEAVVDGVNTEQLQKLIVLAMRVRDQELQPGPDAGRGKPVAGPQPAGQGRGRFWRDSELAARGGDDAAAELEAALAPVDDAAGAGNSPVQEGAGERHQHAGTGEIPPQTKRPPNRTSGKK